MTLTVRPGSESDAVCLREMADDAYQIANLDPPPRVIVDIGANIGAFTVLAASLYPDCTIWAYEPDPENYGLLVRNIAPYRDRIHAVRMAVVDHRDGVTIHPGHGLSHVCTTPPTERCDAHWHDSAERVTAPSMTLADAIDGLDRVDVLKVDTEGSEYEIFTDPAPLKRVDRLRMEIHDYRTPTDLETLRATLTQRFTLTEIGFVPGRGGLWFGECSQ